jgi:competence protein ComEC
MLVGAVAGSHLPASVAPFLVVMVAAAHATALATFVLQRPRPFVVASCLTFAATTWLIAGDASRAALHPPLRVLFDRLAAEEGSGPGRQSGGATRVPEPTLVTVLDGHLRQDATPLGSGVSLSASVERVRLEDGWHDVRGGVLVSVGGVLARDQVGRWRAGRRVRLPVLLREAAHYLDPGVGDYRVALARRGTALVGSVKSGALVEVVGHGGPFAEWSAAGRALARAALVGAVGRWSAESCAIVTAILIGDRAGLDDELQRRLQEAGTYHVIAISGGNIAILAGLMLTVCSVGGISSRLSHTLTAVALVAYAYLVGGGSSVVRATLMGVIYLLAWLEDQRSHPLNAIGVAGAVSLAVSPLSIFDPGFALTFGATIGIVVGAGRLARRLPRSMWLRAPVGLLLASLSAELALLPVSAYAFSRVTFAGLILNFAAIPLMSVAQVAGMIVLPLAAIHGGAACLAGYAAHLGARGLVWSAGLVDLAPWLSVRLPPPALWVIGLYYLGWFARLCPIDAHATAWGDFARRLAHPAATLVVIGSGLWILMDPATLARPRDGVLRLTCLDVGQGDSAVVRFPDGRTLLVDTGGLRGTSSFDIGGRVVSPALWALGVRRLDILAITHADPDHAGGAASVFRDFSPREIWEGIPVPANEDLQVLRRAAVAHAVAWRTLHAGDSATFGGTALRVLHPPVSDWERQRVRNDDSLVIELRLGRVSILLPGDVGAEVERSLTGGLQPSGLCVLKVPHHGSATSSSPALLVAARPTVAILSAGRGGWLGRGVLERYHAAGATMFRTDQDGAVTVETDGNRVEVTTHGGRHRIFNAPH